MELLAKNEIEQLAIDQAGSIGELRTEIMRLREALERITTLGNLDCGEAPEIAHLALEK